MFAVTVQAGGKSREWVGRRVRQNGSYSQLKATTIYSGRLSAADVP